MKSIEYRIMKAAYARGRAWAFTWADFAHIGDRSAIEVTIHRLIKKGKVSKATRGVYYRPKYSNFLGQYLSPDLNEVARAIARKHDWTIDITEAAIQNLLGLSTQVPGRAVFDSDGPNKIVQVGNSTIEFRKKKLAGKNQSPLNKDMYYLRTYGISLDQYNQMFAQQNGQCKICKIHRDKLKRDLAVDHCHDTGKVRGLLCGSCNTGLGSFRDNIDFLQSAIAYLQP